MRRAEVGVQVSAAVEQARAEEEAVVEEEVVAEEAAGVVEEEDAEHDEVIEVRNPGRWISCTLWSSNVNE